MLTPNDGAICIAALIHQTAVFPCDYKDEIIGISNFGTTDNSMTNHVNFEITIPKFMLSEEAKANIIIHIFDSETGWKKYPSGEELFNSTYEISW